MDSNTRVVQEAQTSRSVPSTIFGQDVNIFLKRDMKTIFKAMLGKQHSHKNRNAMIILLVEVEKNMSEAERQAISRLLTSSQVVTKAAILQNIDKQPAQGISSDGSRGECQICIEEKGYDEIHAGKITPGCIHITVICHDCFTCHLNVQLKNTGWTRIQCPFCPQILPADVVEQYISEEVFNKYRENVAMSTVRSLPNFQYCQKSGCGAGQLYDPLTDIRNKVVCWKCGNSACHKCGTSYHEGQTCFEAAKIKHQKDLAATPQSELNQKVIASITNLCPKCMVPILRYQGCTHMTCTQCQTHFRWQQPIPGKGHALGVEFQPAYL